MKKKCYVGRSTALPLFFHMISTERGKGDSGEKGDSHPFFEITGGRKR
jgi:hypothetical protein